MTTAERIKTARKEARITQEALAHKMCVTHHCISMWERGLRQPKYETLARIADALGINVNGLLQTPNTNADRIRAMSDEELAKWLEQIDCYNCDCCIYRHDCRFEYGDLEREHYDCKKGRMEWLKQPVKEDA